MSKKKGIRNENWNRKVSNGMISNRQTLRLYIFDLMGIATLLLPPYLAKLCGANGVYAIVLGTGCGLLYLFYLGWVMKKMKADMFTYLRENISDGIRWIILLCVLLHSLFTAGFCAYIFANLMQYSLVRESSYEVILFVILVVAAYAVRGGIESRARVYEVVFWLVLIPFFLMMLASVRNFEWIYVKPILQWNSTNLAKGIYLVFLLLTPLFFSLFLIGEKEKNYGRNIVKTVTNAILFSGGILLGSYVLLLGNFGVESLSNLRFPVVTLMSTIQFEGNFLKRMDALMLAVWFFTLYALLNLHLHYGVHMLTELGRKRDGGFKQGRCIFLSIVIVFLVGCGFSSVEKWLEVFLSYYTYGAVPFMLFVPGILVVIGSKRKK